MGRDAMISHPIRSKGDRIVCFGYILRVSGDGHQRISYSGSCHSAFGSRLQVPAADGREADT